MNKRPKIQIKLTVTDYIFEVMGLALLVLLIALPVYFYNDLPKYIPKHFNLSGQADAYGGRNLIWMLPAIGIAVYIFMTVVNRFPHVFNYPVKVTDDNVERLYTVGTKAMRIIKVTVLMLFLSLNYKIIQVALKRSNEIGELFMPLSVTALLVVVAGTIYKMIRAK